MPLSLPTASLDLKVVIVNRSNTGNLRNMEWCQSPDFDIIVFTQLAVVVSWKFASGIKGSCSGLAMSVSFRTLINNVLIFMPE